MVASFSEPIVISGTGPDISVGGTPFTRPTPWSGEPLACVPTRRLSQPTRALEPGRASSTSSIAEKWERLAVVSPVAWTAARLPAVHIGSNGASFGCRPKKFGRGLSDQLTRRDRDGGPSGVVAGIAVRHHQRQAVGAAAQRQHHEHRRRGRG